MFEEENRQTPSFGKSRIKIVLGWIRGLAVMETVENRLRQGGKVLTVEENLKWKGIQSFLHQKGGAGPRREARTLKIC